MKYNYKVKFRFQGNEYEKIVLAESYAAAREMISNQYQYSTLLTIQQL